ncbi:MAG: M66 family metalloprotease [Gemmatimonadota bacterium]|nr:M66 family metalloprotease [Gemmatimonadota bacterium]
MSTGAKALSPCLAILLLTACADLALESDRIPAELEIFPAGSLVMKGETLQLGVTVRDQHGEAMEMASWAPLLWKVSDPSVAEIGEDGLLSTLGGGKVTASATLGDLSGAMRFRVNPTRVVLTAPTIYLTQAAQNSRGLVDLIAGRPALLRVFMIGDEGSFYEPSVRVTLFQEETIVFQQVLTPETDYTPSEVREGELDGSVNAVIPGAVIRPGVTMLVELDPEGVVPLAPGSQTRYPAEGAQRLAVAAPQLFRQIIVPTISTQSPDESVYSWTDGLNPESPQVRLARTLMPVGPMQLEVHETYSTAANLRTPEGWIEWLGEISVLYEQEGRRGYYYGVVTGVGPSRGVGYIGYPVSVGLAAADVYAHELGHNMNLQHAPCGGAGLTDPNYPYSDGSIGVWGYDIHGDSLLDPWRYNDVMGYCPRDWISDYHFSRATAHRLDGDGGVRLEGTVPAPRAGNGGDMLVVWGSVQHGGVRLNPSFVLDGPPVLPETDGPYRIDGLDLDDRTEFSLSFAPTPLKFGGGGFVFFVPWEDDWADSLDRILLSGPEGEYVLTGSGEPPMAVVTNPSTGRIQAIVRDWDGDPLPGEGTERVTITRGIPGAQR